MKISIGIVSTTHVDKHNERMAKEALDGMAEQINSKYIPLLIEHDWKRWVGVNLYGEVFKLDDGEYGLVVVSGEFENEEEREKFAVSKQNSVSQDYEHYIDMTKFSSKSKTPKSREKEATQSQRTVADALQQHMNSTSILPDGRVYKIKAHVTLINDLKVYVCPKDHPPAHFHVFSKQRNFDARFYLENQDYYSTKYGRVKESDIKKVKNFFETYPDEVQNLMNEHKRMQKV